MKITKKIIIGGLLAAFLGSVFNRITDPLLDFSSEVLLNIITFGIKKYKDQTYQEIAKNLHESISMELLTLIILAMCTAIFMLFVVLFLKKRFIKFGLKFKKLIMNREKKWVKILLFFYIVFTIALALSSLLRITFINQSVTYYNQLFNIAAPFINEDERLMMRSKFGQIQSKDNYDEIINSLLKVARQNNLQINNLEKS